MERAILMSLCGLDPNEFASVHDLVRAISLTRGDQFPLWVVDHIVQTSAQLTAEVEAALPCMESALTVLRKGCAAGDATMDGFRLTLVGRMVASLSMPQALHVQQYD